MFLASCGSGTAGLIAGSSSSGGSGVPPAITAFSVDTPKEPARAALLFSLSGRATVELLYQLPGEAPQAMSQAGTNPRDLDQGAQNIPWNFADEPGLSASFKDDVLVFARIPGIVDDAREGENAQRLGVGNDAPEVHVVTPMPTDPLDPDESSGNVEIRLRVSDTSSDPVDLTVEWRREGDAPDAWNPAAAAGVFPDGIETTPDPGVELSFFWNTNVDLADEEDTVFFRVTPDDRTAVGSAVTTSVPFRVDNNAEPLVTVDTGFFVGSSDRRRGVPIPYTVSDAEGDEVRLVFQWRRPGETFPELPGSRSGLEAVLADGTRREELRICTELTPFASGRLVPDATDSGAVHLPALGAEDADLVTRGLEGRELQVLRGTLAPEAAAASWSTNPLSGAVAAVPWRRGLEALVLDDPGDGWRLRSVELATGAPKELGPERAVRGPLDSRPSALALESGREAVLVGSEVNGVWRVERVDLTSGAIAAVADARASGPHGPIRDLVSTGRFTAALTVGEQLVTIDSRMPGGAPVTALDGLATPWGLALDPLRPSTLYLAERDAAHADGVGRVLRVDLRTRAREVVNTAPASTGATPLQRPRLLAVEGGGNRLLVVCEGTQGDRLFEVDRGFAQQAAVPVDPPLVTPVASLATGQEGLRLLTSRRGDDLLVAGGVQQVRTITTYARLRATVDAPFEPALEEAQPWRVLLPQRASNPAETTDGAFLWDTSDVFQGGPVFVRLSGYDNEGGEPADSRLSKLIASPWQATPRNVDLGSNALSIAIGDLDADGDNDVACGSRLGINLLTQVAPGEIVGGTILDAGLARALVARDLDGNGLVDVVAAMEQHVSVHFQTMPGEYSGELRLGEGLLVSSSALAAADLDGDGDVDLLAADRGGHQVALFEQLSPRVFRDEVRLLGDRRSAGGVNDLQVADLDGDGRLDVVLGLWGDPQGSGGASLFFQRSPWSFEPLPPGPLNFTNRVVVADLDGDGDLDLSLDVSGAGESVIEVRYQEQPGVFARGGERLGNYLNRAIADIEAGDVDGDGRTDLVVSFVESGGLGFVHLYRQLPGGGFEPEPLAIGGASITQGLLLALGDIDGDARTDLVTTNFTAGAVVTFLQQGPDVAAEEPDRLGSEATLAAPNALAVGDLDQDGDLDVAVCNGETDDLTVFFQGAPRAFDSSALRLASSNTNAPVWVEAVDVEGDGDTDLVSTNSVDHSLSLFRQGADGLFGPDTRISVRSCSDGNTHRPNQTRIADLDGDGLVDLITATQGDSLAISGEVAVNFQTSRGVFESTPSLLLSGCSFSGFPQALRVLDVDRNGELDLVVAVQPYINTSPGMQVIYQDGGQFGRQQFLAQADPAAPTAVAVGDLDNDGLPDIVSVSAGTNQLLGHLQNPDGAFPPSPSFTFGAAALDSPTGVDLADFGGDGLLDIVTSSEQLGTVAVFRQFARGRLSFLPTILGSGQTPAARAVLARDLDRDGEIDVLSANRLANDVSIFWGGR